MARVKLRACGRARDVLLGYVCEPWSWTSPADYALLVFTAGSAGVAAVLCVVGMRVFRGTLPS